MGRSLKQTGALKWVGSYELEPRELDYVEFLQAVGHIKKIGLILERNIQATEPFAVPTTSVRKHRSNYGGKLHRASSRINLSKLQSDCYGNWEMFTPNRE